MSKKHTYEVSIDWTGNLGSGTSTYDAYVRDHLVRVGAKAAIEALSDPAFRGDPARHNSEELFVASLSSCHMLWYLPCATKGIVVTAYVDEAIVTRLRADAHGYCFIANSVNFPMRCEASIDMSTL
ncbi:OsmC/Ohr family protein [Candidatus Burkholderia humilis]|nr:OsmC/Ohr family protein [Candidatus Burkholderia humilis]